MSSRNAMRLAQKGDWHRIVAYARELPFVRDDKPIAYKVTIDEIKNTRSQQQNARYWALMFELSKQAPAHMGGVWHSKDSWHAYCAGRFLPPEMGPFNCPHQRSTSSLSVGEFGDYMTEVEAWILDEFEGFNFHYDEFP